VASPAFAGSQVAYLGSTSQISQSFGTGPGTSGFGVNQYVISLDIGTRADFPGATGTATIVATVGSTVIGEVTYTATAATAGEKTHLSFVTADLSVLGLAGQNVTLTITDGTSAQILVDNVVAQPLNPMTTLSTTQTNTFDYTGAVETVTIGTSGYYDIVADGASGGFGSNQGRGGLGAMASGDIFFRQAPSSRSSSVARAGPGTAAAAAAAAAAS
jgi:hypothetical protein